MKTSSILKSANAAMLVSFVGFIFALLVAYMFEGQFSLMFITVLHVAQLIFAGIFKVAYVVRLVSQKQLGLRVV